MISKLKSIIPKSLKNKLIEFRQNNRTQKMTKSEVENFLKYSFGKFDNIDTFEQLEAQITKAYHSIEKGLAYEEIRLGFGKNAISNLLELLSLYNAKNYSVEEEVYETAIDCLYKYIDSHEKSNFDVSDLKKNVSRLGGYPNGQGGILNISKPDIMNSLDKNFEIFSKSRHSVRNFGDVNIDLSKIEQALNLAQNTPSACNRQGWKVRLVSIPENIEIINANQNGNTGFGDKINKYIIITADIQYFAKPRERNQAYIDGGMYTMNLLYALHYNEIASIPLSASLTSEQERNIRNRFEIQDSEVFIAFIGIGSYKESFKVPKSSRRKVKYKTY